MRKEEVFTMKRKEVKKIIKEVLEEQEGKICDWDAAIKKVKAERLKKLIECNGEPIVKNVIDRYIERFNCTEFWEDDLVLNCTNTADTVDMLDVDRFAYDKDSNTLIVIEESGEIISIDFEKEEINFLEYK